MKRPTLIALANLVFVCLIADVGVAAPPRQSVAGNVILPLPMTGTTKPGVVPPGCGSGVHRRLALITDEAAQGYFGFHFDVDERTWGSNFVLETTNGVVADLDIMFYKDFGDVLLPAEPSHVQPYGQSDGPFETGVVPEEMTKAIVCLAAGAKAIFVYEAGRGVKLPK